MDNLYIYISLKWTHSKDEWFTLWNPDQRGYTVFFEKAGLYFDPYTSDPDESVLSVKRSELIPFVKTVVYEGNIHNMLSNNEEIRKHIGISKENLLARSKYPFSKHETV